MKLLPSLRQKKRYISFEIISDKKFSQTDIEKEAKEAWLGLLGTLGTAKASPIFVSGESEGPTQRFIIKSDNKYVKEIISAMMLIKTIKDTPVIVKSLMVSGTIKKIKKTRGALK